MADRIVARAQRAAAALAPFVGLFLVVVHGKRW